MAAATEPPAVDPFFIRIKQLPTPLCDNIWASYFRIAAEEHAERFKAVHDEMTDYNLNVLIGNKLKLTLCRANHYYAIMGIDDLWITPYMYKYAIEAQLKRDCLRLLRRFHGRVIKQPVVRFGDVIVDAREVYTGPGMQLGAYLGQVPSHKDYAEDMNIYDRRTAGQVEWLSYWTSDRVINNGPSVVGLGVSGLWGLGHFGFESGTGFGLAAEASALSSSEAEAAAESEDDSSSSPSSSSDED
jgi:hypothetical protein